MSDLNISPSVVSITGTANQVTASAPNGAVTLSLPQSIATSSTPQFARLGLGAAADGTYLLNLNGALVHGTSTGVGIGTSSPQTTLTVGSATPGTGEATDKGNVQIQSTGGGVGSAGGLEFKGSAAGSGYGWRMGTPDLGSSNVPLIFQTRINSATWTELGRYTNVGNLKLAGTAARATTEGTNHLDIFNGTAPVGTLANGVSLYSASGELRVMDAGGTSTLLSPHDDENYWVFDSEDTTTGEKLHIDVEKLLRFINDKFKLGFVKGDITKKK